MTIPNYRAIAARAEAARVVAVQNYLGSGTLFLASLLDSHPSLLTIPGLGLRNFIDYCERLDVDRPLDMVGMIVRTHAALFDRHHMAWHEWGLDTLGPDRAGTAVVDRAVFQGHLEAIVPHLLIFNRRTLLCAFCAAYALTLGREVPILPVIVFPLHSKPKWIADDLIADFPDLLFLHMVRHPVSLLVSGVRHITGAETHSRLNPIKSALRQIFLNFTEHGGNFEPYGDRPYQPRLAAQSRAFRLEALHESPRATLESICQFIGIAWDDCLLASTFNGLTWWNRSESPRISGFDPSIPSRGVASDTNACDRLILRLIARPLLRGWGYADGAAAAWLIDPLAAVVVAFGALVPLKLERKWPHRLRVFTAAKGWRKWTPRTLRDWVDAVADDEKFRVDALVTPEVRRQLDDLMNQSGARGLLCLLPNGARGRLPMIPVPIDRQVSDAVGRGGVRFRALNDVYAPPSLATQAARILFELVASLAVWLGDYGRIRLVLWTSFVATRRDRGLIVGSGEGP